ncbi:MAG: helix-turn-helix domain-containing protein [Bacteroidota bacterium]
MRTRSNKPFKIALGLLGALVILVGCATDRPVTLVIDELPKSTPVNAHLYCSSSLNFWDPDSEKFKFKKGENGHYYLSLKDFNLDVVSYLITRGNWSTVESTGNGAPIHVRKLTASYSRGDTLYVQVRGWSDLDLDHTELKHMTLKVLELPENSPPGSSLFVSGDFNGWVPGDDRYKLREKLDGTFEVKIPVRGDEVQYKFTRGNWLTSESMAFGRPSPNRKLAYSRFSSYKGDKIEYWSDQSFGLFNPYGLFLLLTAFLGIFLILIIMSLKNTNRRANIYLSVLIVLISISLGARILVYDRDIFYYFPRLEILPDIVYFLYAPIFFIYIGKLLYKDSRTYSLKRNWWFFVPFFLQLVLYLKFFLEPTHTFIDRAVIQVVHPTIYVVVAAFALLFNSYFWVRCKDMIGKYLLAIEDSFSEDQNLVYLKKVMAIKLLCLIFWALAFLVGGMGYFFGWDTNRMTHTIIDVSWAIFSLNVFVLGYFSISQPEIFKVADREEPPEPSSSSMDSQELKEICGTLEKCMKEDRLYLDPQLSLPDLSGKLGFGVHVISRAINEGFQKNFRDFVNSYRIEEFIVRAKDENYKNQTFLGIALDVGFNSKSSFNRSFRKYTGQTPREYFKND